MKSRFLILWIFATIVFSSCKEDPTFIADGQLKGTWELRKTSGMMGVSTFLSGNGNKIVFTDSTMTGYVAGQPGTPVIYSIGSTNVDIYNVHYDQELVVPGPKLVRPFKVTGGTLVMWTGLPAYDGGMGEYEKIAN